MFRQPLLVFAFTLAATGCTGNLQSERPVYSEDARRCIPLMQIAEVKVLDPQTIEFRLHGGKTYLNLLPHKCPGLRHNQPFMYRTSLSQLCDLDLITVLDTGGFGFRPLASCGLGRFEPLIIGGVPVVED